MARLYLGLMTPELEAENRGAGPGFPRAVATSVDWNNWLMCVTGDKTESGVRRHLVSNLKFVLCGLEMKAGLLLPHFLGPPSPPTLYEPHANVMTQEFCYGTFSVFEGLGSLFHRLDSGGDGSATGRVTRQEFHDAIVRRIGPIAFPADRVGEVRDLLHQDKLAGRSDIDWHEQGYERALLPALTVLQALFQICPDHVPEDTILRERDWAARWTASF